MPSSEFSPRVTVFAKMLVELKYAPHIVLVVLFVLRMNGVEFAGSAG
jgi:hypothetical protein